MHCFDDVKAIVFLVGLSGYHQVPLTNEVGRRMRRRGQRPTHGGETCLGGLGVYKQARSTITFR